MLLMLLEASIYPQAKNIQKPNSDMAGIPTKMYSAMWAMWGCTYCGIQPNAVTALKLPQRSYAERTRFCAEA